MVIALWSSPIDKFCHTDSLLSVRELHNTSEGVNDPWGRICVDEFGKSIPCYTDYWKHIKYLSMGKKELDPKIIVWMSKELNQQNK